MARKTAMGKEPGNVSIALPQSEKDRLNRLGKFQPGDPGMAKKLMDGAKPLPLKRLSPGVYRNNAGQLVGSKGQALPGQRTQSLQERALNAANRAMQGDRPAPRPNQQQPQQPMSPQERDLVNQATGRINDVLNNYMPPKSPMEPGFGPNASLADLQNLYPNEDFNSQVFGNPAMTTGFGPKPYPMQNQMYPFPQGQQRQVQDLMLRYPPGTPMPNLQQMQEMFRQQQQAAQQPQSVSGLLQRNR